MTTENETHDLIDRLWNDGRVPRLLVDGTRADVVVPLDVKKQFGERLPIDLDPTYPLNPFASPEAFIVDLAFSHRVIRCVFPWDAIYAVTDRDTHMGVMFKSRAPKSVLEKLGEPPPTDFSVSSKPALRAVASAGVAKAITEGVTPEKMVRPALRAIKGGKP